MGPGPGPSHAGHVTSRDLGALRQLGVGASLLPMAAAPAPSRATHPGGGSRDPKEEGRESEGGGSSEDLEAHNRPDHPQPDTTPRRALPLSARVTSGCRGAGPGWLRPATGLPRPAGS